MHLRGSSSLACVECCRIRSCGSDIGDCDKRAAGGDVRALQVRALQTTADALARCGVGNKVAVGGDIHDLRLVDRERAGIVGCQTDLSASNADDLAGEAIAAFGFNCVCVCAGTQQNGSAEQQGSHRAFS